MSAILGLIPPALLLALGLSGGVLIAAVICIYFLFNPEKFQKWASMIAWFFSTAWKNLEYYAIKNEIQGDINSFVRTLEAKTTANFPRISIKWAGKENEEFIWEEGEAILVMKDRQSRTKNVVHATYFFTSEALLRKSKKHLAPAQKTSLDLFATLKILQTQDPDAVEQFIADYISPEVQKDEAIRNLIKKFTKIERIGVFFPILVQELVHLGSKVFLAKPTQEVIEEVKLLVQFLENFAEREVGDITTADTFWGKYTRCTIKIVASKQVREKGNVDSQVKRVSYAIQQKLENIYVIGSGEEINRRFMDEVIEGAISDNPGIKLIKSYEFAGQIRMAGEFKSVKSYLAHLRNPGAIKYLYEENDLAVH